MNAFLDLVNHGVRKTSVCAGADDDGVAYVRDADKIDGNDVIGLLRVSGGNCDIDEVARIKVSRHESPLVGRARKHEVVVDVESSRIEIAPRVYDVGHSVCEALPEKVRER